MPTYSQVTITVTNKGEKRDAWFVFESPHNSLKEQIDQMLADGGLNGVRHDTRTINMDGDRQIVDSYATFVDRQIIVSVTELRHRVFDRDNRRVGS
ncbi:MAG: hypothetical protein E6Q97_31965 [Desulfurellales bacterium]|nr:MAG: hypothetical protein E6Q97_31965 [Desulfurellales bacterium]